MIVIEADSETELDEIVLLHPEIIVTTNPSLDYDALSLRADSTELYVGTQIKNTGNGELRYRVKHTEIDNDTHITPLDSFAIGRNLNLHKLYGVLYIDSLFYVPAKDGGNRVIYKFDTDGDSVGFIDQPDIDALGFESDVGFNNLAWDGENFWGGIVDFQYYAHIVKFTPDGEVLKNFDSPNHIQESNSFPAVNFCEERGSIYFTASRTNIFEIDTSDGEVINEFEIRLPRRNFNAAGILWNPLDSDGMNIYFLRNNREASADPIANLYKMNPETGEYMFVAELPARDGAISYAGLSFVPEYGENTRTVICVTEKFGMAPDPDGKIRLYDIGPNYEILGEGGIINNEGVIAPQDSTEFGVRFNVEGWSEAVHRFALKVEHNAAGGDVLIPITLTISEDASVGGDLNVVPTQFGLTGVYPNPFNSMLKIDFDIVDPGQVSLQIFDLTGRLVASLIDENLVAGSHSAAWNGTHVTSGLYFVRLQSGEKIQTVKTALVK